MQKRVRRCVQDDNGGEGEGRGGAVPGVPQSSRRDAGIVADGELCLDLAETESLAGRWAKRNDGLSVTPARI